MGFEDITNQEDNGPEISKEYLEGVQTLEVVVEAELDDLLSRINEDLGVNLEARPEGYHITIISPPEAKKLKELTEEQIARLKEINDSISQGNGVEVKGLGMIDGSAREDLREVDKKKKTLYIALDIPELQQFREEIGLEPKDFHITVGFEEGDIHMAITGYKENGKPILSKIEKKADSEFSKYSEDLPEFRYSHLQGQEKQKKAE